MKTRYLLRFAAVLFSAVCLQGCGAPATPPPEPTATDTAAVSPTATHKGGVTVIYVENPPTKTRLPTRNPTHTPIPPCGIAEGWWESEEHAYMAWMTTPWPMLAFHVEGCGVWEFQIEVYAAHGKEFGGNFETQKGSIENKSFSVSFENPNGAGTFSIYGKFESKDLCQGFIMFSKGFQLEDYFLPDVETIAWNAGPPTW
jgi:hypothetical protein